MQPPRLFQGRKAMAKTLALWSVTLAVAMCSLAACSNLQPATSAVATAPGVVIAIDQTPRGVQIPLPSTVLFQFGKSELDKTAAQPYLEKIARLIKNKTSKRVSVEGHTDNIGSLVANQQLSDARANTVLEALQTLGVPRDQMTAEGFAYQRPLVSNDNDAGRALNRRVEVFILEEKVENITAGEPGNAFESALKKLKAMVDQGLVKPI
jgi:outer membrane protein OmpA-like peptidoglycan-associated protein